MGRGVEHPIRGGVREAGGRGGTDDVSAGENRPSRSGRVHHLLSRECELPERRASGNRPDALPTSH